MTTVDHPAFDGGTVLTGQFVRLRPFTERDLDTLWEMLNEPEGRRLTGCSFRIGLTHPDVYGRGYGPDGAPRSPPRGRKMSPPAAALVTGANHGIGAATAIALARAGHSVALSYLVIEDEPDPGTPETYRINRARDASQVLEQIRDEGGVATAISADLPRPTTPIVLFDRAEAELGPVGILVNNATGWVADTFTASATDRLGRDEVAEVAWRCSDAARLVTSSRIVLR